MVKLKINGIYVLSMYNTSTIQLYCGILWWDIYYGSEYQVFWIDIYHGTSCTMVLLPQKVLCYTIIKILWYFYYGIP